jgi:hypothetical protein
MKVNGPADCVLNKTERIGLKTAYAVVDQIAWHYRGTAFGAGCQQGGECILAILNDAKLCGEKTDTTKTTQSAKMESADDE